MRVAFYAPLKPPTAATPSGDRRMARLLLRAIRRGGHEAVLASRFRSYDGAGDPARQAALQRRGEGLAARLAEKWANGRGRPDLWFTYHLYYKAPDWLGPVVSAALDIPYVVAEASFAPKRADGPWDAGHRAVERAIGAADHVFSLNADDEACIRPLMRPDASASLLPPFVDAGPYRRGRARRADTRSRLADRHGLDPGTPWLLAVGMMRPGDKLASYQVLADALGRCRYRPWQLLIVGGGAAESHVSELFAPFSDRVVLLGRLDGAALTPIYGACDLFVWPAVREAFGMAVLEAQAAGLPVVAGRTGGVPGIVADGETGLLIPPGDTGGFADAARALLENGSLRESMGAAALARVQASHDLPQAAERLDSVFRKIDPQSR
jgi:glycosyltransferase involved in cell wall biosynthesis